jgi:hypothetical protein
MKEIIADPFEVIWTRPVDYREMLGNRSGASDPPINHIPYCRDAAREESIERAIHTHSILDNRGKQGL